MGEEILENIVNVTNGIRVSDSTLLNWVSEDQVLSLILSLLTNIPLFLVHADQDASILGFAQNHGDHVLGGIFLAETSLEVSSSDIDHKGFVVVFHQIN